MSSSKNATNQDGPDFVAMVRGMNTTLGRYAQECVDRGGDPRAITAALETAAKTARSWCVARYMGEER